MGYGKSSFSDDYDIIATIEYKYGDKYISDNDKCTHIYIKITKRDVYNINAIALDAPCEHIYYKSEVSLYKSIKYYESIYSTRDYSVLKRKLFESLNRTHNESY